MEDKFNGGFLRVAEGINYSYISYYITEKKYVDSFIKELYFDGTNPFHKKLDFNRLAFHGCTYMRNAIKNIVLSFYI